MDLYNIRISFTQNFYNYLKLLLSLYEENNKQPFKISFNTLSKRLNLSSGGINGIHKKMLENDFYTWYADNKNTAGLVYFTDDNLDNIKNYKNTSYSEQYSDRAKKAMVTKTKAIQDEMNELYEILGYDINSEISIHEQFMKKHKLI
jgi:hypothetical protein